VSALKRHEKEKGTADGGGRGKERKGRNLHREHSSKEMDGVGGGGREGGREGDAARNFLLRANFNWNSEKPEQFRNTSLV